MTHTSNTPTTIEVWHNSPIRVTAILDRPIWFSLTQHDGLGYWYSREEDGGESHLYSAEVTGRFVDILEIEESLQKAGYDVDDTIADIASNPDEVEVMGIPGVAHLASLGWDGIIYPDYNQWDPKEDTDALLVFSPKGKIRSLSEVVDTKGKAKQAAEASGYDWSLDESHSLRHLRHLREWKGFRLGI
jgi:hypothetical protein